VDRDRFSAEVTRAVREHPRIDLVCEEVTRIPDARPVILATGPLTGDALTEHLAEVVGRKHPAYHDAIAPTLAPDSILWDRVWKQSRYGKGGAVKAALAMDARAADSLDPDYREDQDPGDEAYVNCPFNEDEYRAFVRALVSAEKV